MPDERVMMVGIFLGSVSGMIGGLVLIGIVISDRMHGSVDTQWLEVVFMLSLMWGYAMWGFRYLKKQGWFSNWFQS